MLAVRLDPLLCMQSRRASVLVSDSILVLPPGRRPSAFTRPEKCVDRPGSTHDLRLGSMHNLERIERVQLPRDPFLRFPKSDEEALNGSSFSDTRAIKYC